MTTDLIISLCIDFAGVVVILACSLIAASISTSKN